MPRPQNQARVIHDKLALLSRVVLVVLLASLPFLGGSADAASLQNRSVTIGSSNAGDTTTNDFRFSTATPASIGSISFEYCFNSPDFGTPCTPAPGFDSIGATLSFQSGMTSFAINVAETTSNRIVLSRVANFEAPKANQYIFDNIQNPTTPNLSVFVRMSVHTSTNGSGTPVDEGAVVFYTVDNVTVGGTVPPYLRFCAAETVSLDCGTINGNLLDLGELSENTASTTTSQFAVATNDPTGYNVFMSGGTMTSGNEVIPNLTSNSPSVIGTSQFGINLRSNSSPSSGANVAGIGSGAPSASYNTPNSFRYINGEQIAGSSLPTYPNLFTVTYLVNVSDSQKPGIYASSFTFTGIASF